jgi:hypothetical protein
MEAASRAQAKAGGPVEGGGGAAKDGALCVRTSAAPSGSAGGAAGSATMGGAGGKAGAASAPKGQGASRWVAGSWRCAAAWLRIAMACAGGGGSKPGQRMSAGTPEAVSPIMKPAGTIARSVRASRNKAANSGFALSMRHLPCTNVPYTPPLPRHNLPRQGKPKLRRLPMAPPASRRPNMC